MNYRLGLDIGIASVGWGIVDENDNVIDAGVRIFPEAGKDGNEARRTKRGSRRLLRRRAFRAERVKRLLVEYKIIDNLDYDFYTNETTPYLLRKKGLNEKLTDNELAIALLHLVKRRGIHNVDAAETVDEKKGEKSTKNVITENTALLKDKYICEVQIERLKKQEIDLNNGAVRGVDNRFKTSDYEAEARRILEIQNNYNEKIKDEFIERYIEILLARREYYDGPGEPSRYGWKDEIEWMEKLVGMCTYYPDEMRLVKNSYSAELFNLLNDLNNLNILREENTKLTKEEKEKIIELFKTTKKKETEMLKLIAKIIDVDENDITGYRVSEGKNKDDRKSKFTIMKSYNEINGILGIDERDLFDEISKIATYYQTEIEKSEKFKELFKEKAINITEEQIEKISKLNYTGTHSLSKKAINEIIDDLMETTKNQMELFNERGLVPYKMDFKGKVNIPKTYIDEWILSPTVKRSMGQTINVVNAVMKRYGKPSEIVIELAREKNSDDKKKFIQEMQKKNKDINDKAKEILNSKKIDHNGFEKIKYWHLQDGICMYSLEEIKIEELLAYPDNFEVDHILPRSISFDDSQSNKVLVKRVENQKKGNKTPYEYLSSGNGKISYDEYKAKIRIMKNIDKKKVEKLLFEGELSKYAGKFIARNLVDTRYATRELMNMFKKFYRDNEIEVKVKSINGSFTSQIRKQWKLVKDRELSHVHHAQDALIVLMGEKIANKLRWVRDFNKGEAEEKYNVKTGEILSDEEYKELFADEYRKRVIKYDKFRFSHFVDKKPNRQLSDETIYGTRIVKEIESKGKKEIEVENEYIIGKLGNIYDEKDTNIKKYFEDEKKKSQLLMFSHDKQTLAKFEKIYEEYKKEKNPFAAYFKEHGFITKYAKKENGPIVKELKYRVSKLGSCLDLSHKYNSKNRRVVMLSIPSYRADFYKKGDTYKFVSVTYLMMRDKGKYYEMDMEKYSEAKAKKEIDDSFKFVFSAYRGDVMEIEKDGGETEKVKFKGVNDDEKNKFECDWLDRNYVNYINALKELDKIVNDDKMYDPTDKLNLITGGNYTFLNSKEVLEGIPKSSTQKVLTIGRNIKNVKKVYVDVLGYEYSGIENFKEVIEK